MLFSTVSSGRLHLAQEASYVGSINSYNNFLTRFAALILGKSVNILVNGKYEHLNRKSYGKFFKSQKIEADKYSNIDSFAEQLKLPEKESFMRDHLTVGKINQLSKKLQIALSKGEFKQARIFTGQGANPDRIFWIRSNSLYPLENSRKDLPFRSDTWTARSFSAPLYAGMKKQKELVAFMRAVGSLRKFEGEVVRITRSKVYIGTSITVKRKPQAYYQNSRKGLAMRISEKKSLTQKDVYRDTVTKTGTISFNSEGEVVESKITPVTIETSYRSQVKRYRIR